MKLLYCFSHAPYGTSNGQEGLDALLVGAAFEQQVSVLFVDDGVYQINSRQSVAGTPLKQFTKAFAALNDFGIEQVFVHESSLRERGLSMDDLMPNVQLINDQQCSELLHNMNRVFHF